MLINEKIKLLKDWRIGVESLDCKLKGIKDIKITLKF